MKKCSCSQYFRFIKLCFVSAILFFPAQQSLAEDETNWARITVKSRVFTRNLQALTSAKQANPKINIGELIKPMIVGGAAVTSDYQNPFQVAILQKSISSNFQAQFCGGTAISTTQIVTAAHCSDFVSPNQVQVLVNTRKLDGTGTRVNVSSIVIHPDWNSTSFDNDVAIWNLSDSISSTLADLAISDGDVGDDFLVTGWGNLFEGAGWPTSLHAAKVPLVSRSNCNDSNSYNGDITSNMLCAGYNSGGTDSCQGDSGGPLTGGITNRVLKGIVSWGFGCARPNLFGVYTRISSPSVRDFIKKNVPSPVYSSTGYKLTVSSYGTESNVYVGAPSTRRLWGTRKYADVQATANAYCAGLGKGKAISWEADSCGEDESSYVRFNPTKNQWESRDSGSANNKKDYCRYPLLSSISCKL